MKGHDGYCRTKCDEIIARRPCIATRAWELILRIKLCYDKVSVIERSDVDKSLASLSFSIRND
jgi:hypothetical protein